jgi:hypothetical protein
LAINAGDVTNFVIVVTLLLWCREQKTALARF